MSVSENVFLLPVPSPLLRGSYVPGEVYTGFVRVHVCVFTPTDVRIFPDGEYNSLDI